MERIKYNNLEDKLRQLIYTNNIKQQQKYNQCNEINKQKIKINEEKHKQKIRMNEDINKQKKKQKFEIISQKERFKNNNNYIPNYRSSDDEDYYSSYSDYSSDEDIDHIYFSDYNDVDSYSYYSDYSSRKNGFYVIGNEGLKFSENFSY
jgi:hypothetical protein